MWKRLAGQLLCIEDLCCDFEEHGTTDMFRSWNLLHHLPIRWMTIWFANTTLTVLIFMTDNLLQEPERDLGESH